MSQVGTQMSGDKSHPELQCIPICQGEDKKVRFFLKLLSSDFKVSASIIKYIAWEGLGWEKNKIYCIYVNTHKCAHIYICPTEKYPLNEKA